MGYSLDELSMVLAMLIDEGINYVIIGDTVIQLALKRRVFEGDIDIFALNPSPLADEEFYISLAEKHGWGYGTTEIGTPRLIVQSPSGEIIVEIYENFMDIEIPMEILENAGSIRLMGRRIKLIKPEQYIVLKARQGVDLDKLKHYIDELKNINMKLVEKTIKLFPRDEQELIMNRLRNLGLRI